MRIAVIGGSGFDQWSNEESGPSKCHQHQVTTNYSQEPILIDEYNIAGHHVYFLARHGAQHQLPPHLINYRANIAALKQLKVDTIIAITAVGSITKTMLPEQWVVPDQIIDYTYGRQHSYACENNVTHIDFTYPFSSELRTHICQQLEELSFIYHPSGIYACTQGPRLETSAEIQRLARDGCDIVGMTAMPEAALAREMNIPYANLSMIVNKAAGIDSGMTHIDEVFDIANRMGQQAQGLLLKLIGSIEAKTIYPL